MFDSAIGAAYPEAAATATPVVNINMHSEGKYAFVELATEEFAAAAMQLDKLDLCGRSLNVARPSGYVDPATQTAQQAAMVSVLGAVFIIPVPRMEAPGLRILAAGLLTPTGDVGCELSAGRCCRDGLDGARADGAAHAAAGRGAGAAEDAVRGDAGGPAGDRRCMFIRASPHILFPGPSSASSAHAVLHISLTSGCGATACIAIRCIDQNTRGVVPDAGCIGLWNHIPSRQRLCSQSSKSP